MDRIDLDSATVEGQTVKVGDYVGFKSDIEQGGRIVKIQRRDRYDPQVVLTVVPGDDHFHGEYLRTAKTAELFPEDCWL